jgi:hypothetical protein
MANEFPATSTSNRDDWVKLSTLTKNMRNGVVTLRDNSIAGDIPRNTLLALKHRANTAITAWGDVVVTVGLQKEARDDYGDQTYDLQLSLNQCVAAGTVLRDWLFDSLPTEAGDGALILETDARTSTRTTPLVLVSGSGAATAFQAQCDLFLLAFI